MKIQFDIVHELKWMFDDSRRIGVMVLVKERKLYHLMEICTINGMHEPNRTESFVLPKRMEKLLIKPLINHYFKKIKHRYIEWGMNPDINFPWKVSINV